MSKHAVVGLTKEIGVDYARDKVHCNCLCPSCKSYPDSRYKLFAYPLSAESYVTENTISDQQTVIDTPLIAPITKDAENPIAVGTTQALIAAHPWGTLGQTDDVARAAVFLVSEDSQWITGQQLVIDGGYMAK